jgi:hypothetical protein
VPARVAATLALYDELRAAGLTKTGLARRLGIPDTEARRLLDLDHPPRWTASNACSRASTSSSW